MTGIASCPFCRKIEAGEILLDGGVALALADGFPISNGHALVIPRRHESDFFALSVDEHAAILEVLRRLKELVSAEHHPDAFNIGVNVGEAAGQTVGHAHLHLIPRYRGDVDDPRGGVRWILPEKAKYWTK